MQIVYSSSVKGIQKMLSGIQDLVKGTVYLAALLLVSTTTLLAQSSTATFGGRVFDAQSKVVQHAVVTVTSEETGSQWRSVTNNDGDWRVESLTPGHYRFQVEAPGFKTLNHSAVELQVSDQKFVDAKLDVGAVTDSIVVTSATPLIDTTSAVSGTVITTAELEDLPSATNSPTALVGLTPGAVIGLPSGGAAHLWSNISGSAVQVDFSGAGTNAVNYQIEGSSDTNGSGQIAFIPPMEAVTELRVSKNAYDASIGRTAAGTIDMTVKSGTQGFHGEAYEFNQNNTLNAKQYNQTSPVVPAVHTNEFGGSLGGPVWIPKIFDGRKKHTFFFFNYDGIRNKSPLSTGTVSVPTALERAGDFGASYTVSNGVSYQTNIFDPTTYNPVTKTRSLYPCSTTPPAINPNTKIAATGGLCPGGFGEMIPGAISPIAKAYYALLPLPDATGDGASSDSNNFTNASVKFDPFNSYILRVDNSWNDSHHSYVELRYNDLKEVQSSVFGLTNILSGIDLNRKNLGMTLDHAWVVSPRFLVDLRGNITAYDTDSVSPTFGINPTSFGFPSALVGFQSTPSVPQISGLPTPSLGTSQGSTYENDINYEGVGNVTQIVGRHALKYGAEYLVQQQADGNIGITEGSFNFGTQWTTQNPDATAGPGIGSSVASFDLGLPNNSSNSSIGIPATSFWSQPYVAVFFQDDWRATNKLTLNLGLRWDEQRPLTERYDKFFVAYDPNANVAPVTAAAQPAYAAEIAGSSTNIGIQFLQQNRPNASTFVARGEPSYAGVNGTSRAVTNSTLKYFQPRVGFAYTFGPRTVLRGGIGRFVEANYVPGHGNQAGFSATTPFLASNDNYHTQYATLSNPFPQGIVPVTGNSLGGLTNPGGISSYYNPTVPRQYSDEVSAHLQQQAGKYLFEIGGTLNITHGIGPIGYDIDEPGTAVWLAANGPQFDSTGRPLDVLSGNTLVPNPFKGAPGITTSLETATTVTAYSLVRPNPLVDISENQYTGKNWFYSLQTRAERRFSNGFGVLGAFTWGKDMVQSAHILPQAVSEELKRQLSGSDQRFLISITPTYVLPIGRGQLIGKHMNRWADLVVGGWKLSGIYTYNSGTPVGLPTNGSFFQGGDPSSGPHTRQQWFNTSKFVPFPTRSTTVAQLAAYPAWTGVTGLPGAGWAPTSSSDASKNGVYNDFGTWATNNDTTYGNIRNPSYQNVDAGLRKSFAIEGTWSFELRFDAFNALNHPTLNGPGTTAGSAYFGYLGNTSPNLVTQANNPRAIQFAGKLYF
jgi:hypothetical protein